MTFTLWHRPVEPEAPSPPHAWRSIVSDDHAFLVDHIAEDSDRRSAWRIVPQGAERPVLWTGGAGRAAPFLPPAWPGWNPVDPRIAWCEKHDWLSAWTYCERADWMLDGLIHASPTTTRAKRTQIARAAEAIVRPHLHHQRDGRTLAAETLDMAAAEFGNFSSSDRLRKLATQCRSVATNLCRFSTDLPSPSPQDWSERAVLLAAESVALSIDAPLWAADSARKIHDQFSPDARHASRDADIVRRFLTPDAVYLALSDWALDSASR